METSLSRQNFSGNSSWEEIVGYSRAVRVGNLIEVAGTTAISGNEVVGKDDFYEQAKFILQKIEKVLLEAGAGMKHVIRTRMFVTDIGKWQEIGRAHGEVFAAIKPAATMVEVSNLIHPDLLVEIEATAFLSDH